MIKEVEVEVTEHQKIHTCNLCGMEADWHVFNDYLAFCKKCAGKELEMDVNAFPLDYRVDTNDRFPSKKVWFRVDTRDVAIARGLFCISMIWLSVLSGWFYITQGTSATFWGHMVVLGLFVASFYMTRKYKHRKFQEPDESWVKLGDE